MEDSAAAIDTKAILVFLVANLFLPLLGGLASGLLVSIRWRTAAAYSLIFSIIIGYGTAKTATGSTEHKDAASVFILFGTIFPCVITILVVGIKGFVSRIIRRIRWLLRAITSDVSEGIYRLRELSKPRRPLASPRRAIALPWRSVLLFAFLPAAFVVGENAQRILDYLDDNAPKMGDVTNTMDLISLIFVTPKCFSGVARDNLHKGFASLAKSAFGRGIENSDPHHVLKLGVFLFITIFPALYLLSLWEEGIGQQIVDTMKTFLSGFRSKGVEVYGGDSMVKAMSGWLLIANRFQTFVAATAKVSATMAISLAVSVRVRKMNQLQQKNWEDLLFGVGIVIFAYSRSLSMLN